MIKVLFHKAPDGYHYTSEPYQSNIVSIFLHHHYPYSFSNGKPVKTIWGFYDKKKKCFYEPVNSKKHGSVVDINKTTPYTAKQITNKHT